MHARGLSTAILVAGFALADSSAQPPRPAPQRQFTAEDSAVNHPVPLPAQVFEVLSHHEASRIFGDDDKPDTPSPDWYSAEMLRSPSARVDLFIVMATGPLVGANVSPFWLVRFDRSTHQATILWSMPTHSVTLRYPPGSHYPQIHTAALTAVHVWEATFDYNSGKYLITHSADYPIGSPRHGPS